MTTGGTRTSRRPCEMDLWPARVHRWRWPTPAVACIRNEAGEAAAPARARFLRAQSQGLGLSGLGAA